MAKTVLYVDDEPAVLRAMARDLLPWLEQKNLTLKTADSASACLDFLKHTDDDVVLVMSDLRMPGMKGSELLERLAGLYPDIGLVLVTAYSDMDDITRAVAANIGGLVIKPWNVERLTSELDRIVDRLIRRRNTDRKHHEILSQLEIAGDFQDRYFETTIPAASNYTVEASSRPAPGLYVTGDFYEIVPIGKDRLLVLLGDVSGHGIKPALIATMIKGIIYDYQNKMVDRGAGTEAPDAPPAELRVDRFMGHLNTAFFDRLPGIDEVLVSFSAALVDTAAATVTYSGGGNPPLHLLRNRQVQRLTTHHPALGFSRDITYESTQVPLQENDRLVLFTDGLYDRGAKRTVPESVISSLFIQADDTTPFIPQVERLLDAVDLMETTQDSSAGTTGVPSSPRRDDLTIISVKIKDLHDRN